MVFDMEKTFQSKVKDSTDFTIQELWDELTQRGCVIENNRLVQITTTVFE